MNTAHQVEKSYTRERPIIERKNKAVRINTYKEESILLKKTVTRYPIPSKSKSDANIVKKPV